MTLIVAFLGVDSRAPASLYIASDSRISWGNISRFDYGRKVFACRNSPDIFGYCGDAFFPSMVLNQIISVADSGLLFEPNWPCKRKFQSVFNKLVSVFNEYPKEVAGIMMDSLEIIHASRDDHGFFCRKMMWQRKTGKWTSQNVKFNTYSDKIFVAGSGKKEFLAKFDQYWKSSNQKTSRAIFHCFCDTLADIKDKACGGSPQLVGLFRKYDGKVFGVIQNKKRSVLGLPVNRKSNINLETLDWRNELFEVCDGLTMKKKSNAKSQPNLLRR